jgi:hypothetical protein
MNKTRLLSTVNHSKQGSQNKGPGIASMYRSIRLTGSGWSIPEESNAKKVVRSLHLSYGGEWRPSNKPAQNSARIDDRSSMEAKHELEITWFHR